MTYADLTVALVDDSEHQRHYLGRILKQQRIRIVGEADNGLSGLDMVRRVKPHFAVLDIVLPQMSGLEVLRQLVAEPDPPVCLMASGSMQRKEHAMKWGAKGFLVKPYDDIRTWTHILAPILRENFGIEE